MTTYELETGTIGFILLPSDATEIEIRGIRTAVVACVSKERKPYWYSEALPVGFKPLSLFSQLKEEDVKEVMPKMNDLEFNGIAYEDFTSTSICDTALESIHSLAQHLGFNSVNAYSKPLKLYDAGDFQDKSEYEAKLKQWQQAQSKVKQYFVVFKAKQ